MFSGLAKSLIIMGCILLMLGIFLSVSHNFPTLGRLPGDFLIKKKDITLYFPLTSGLIISIIISCIINFLK